jgi:hypothetical protein
MKDVLTGPERGNVQEEIAMEKKLNDTAEVPMMLTNDVKDLEVPLSFDSVSRFNISEMYQSNFDMSETFISTSTSSITKRLIDSTLESIHDNGLAENSSSVLRNSNGDVIEDVSQLFKEIMLNESTYTSNNHSDHGCWSESQIIESLMTSSLQIEGLYYDNDEENDDDQTFDSLCYYARRGDINDTPKSI